MNLTPGWLVVASLFSGVSGGAAAMIVMAIMAAVMDPADALAMLPALVFGGFIIAPIAGLLGAPFSVPTAAIAGTAMYFAGRWRPVLRSPWAWAPVGAVIGAVMSQTVDLHAFYLGFEGDPRDSDLRPMLVPGIGGGIVAALVFRNILRWDADADDLD